MFVVIQVKQNLKLKLETQFQLKAYSLIPILDVVKEHNRGKTRTLKNVVPEVMENKGIKKLCSEIRVRP